MNISFKISFLILLVLGLGFIWQADWQFELIKKQHRESVEEPLIDFAVLMAAQVAHTYPQFNNLQSAFNQANRFNFSAKIYEYIKSQIDLRIYICDLTGRVIFDSDNNKTLGADYSKWNDVIKAQRGEIGARSSKDPSTNFSVMYISAPVIKDGQIIASLTVAKPGQSVNALIENSSRYSVFYLAAGFAVIAIVILALSYYITRPIAVLTDYAENIRDGQEKEFPKLPGGEVGRLGRSILEMQESLQGQKQAELYIKTLTHEMRSPITAISGALEILKEEPDKNEQHRFLDVISDQTERLKKLISDLQILSQLQNKNNYQFQNYKLNNLVAEVVAEYQSQLECKNLTIRSEVLSSYEVATDAFLFAKALGNLLLNAIDFSPAGTEIIIKAELIGRELILSIIDSGAGVPEWALNKVFDKFFSLPRPDSKKRSSGLGLTIVKEIMALHSGRVEYLNNSRSGAEFRMIFSLAIRS